jgi:hypothetical protein
MSHFETKMYGGKAISDGARVECYQMDLLRRAVLKKTQKKTASISSFLNLS